MVRRLGDRSVCGKQEVTQMPEFDQEAAFFGVVSRQRACRSFSDEPVSDEQVGELLRAATFAPSSENLQPWAFVVVRSHDTRHAIGTIMAELWSAGREHSQRRSDPKVFADVDRGLRGRGIVGAPVLVVVGGDTRLVHRKWLLASIYPAVQNLLLAACALGLGSAFTTIATNRGDDLRELVGFPPEVDPLAVVPIGRPARPLGPPRREPFQQKTSRERYGKPW
jgi:nitroreductase